MKLISILGHPLLMATYLSGALLLTTPELFAIPVSASLYLLLAVFLTTCLIPGISILSLKLFSTISSLELVDKKERLLPFFMIFIWYGVSAYLFTTRIQLGQPFPTIFITSASLIGVLLIVTIWFKISIHATAIWGNVGILASLMLTRGITVSEVLIGFILLGGLTATSRLYLGYHRPKEVWVGTILGFIFCFIAVFVFG